MGTNTGLIAVDWGTTNRRAWALAADGAVEDRIADGLGILSVPDFPAAIAALRARWGDRPMLLAGMVGSNRGWIEAPYVPCPAGIAELANGLMRAEGAAIVPGVCDIEDVMRGEEVQLIGAVAAGLMPRDGAACLPGTHAKWARIEDGAIAGFRTVMTGEIFALLKQHSILSAQLQAPVRVGDAFIEGVQRGLDEGELLADLFTIRARALLGGIDDPASHASGLLIGSDVAIGLGVADDGPVALIGDPALTALYAAALEEAERDSVQIDGETAFLAGIHAIASAL
ncbi:2-dehydro-3-deoxygalactonokinase [Sphingomonas sp. LB-2]|uniref:2-dehydro-3-deoxygalactonokinase n=1 Tax=Sphingomonas caeni TaxID=2984949 RepID=UPI0022304573|nr:2-dehydro-3-deoxygalactonokinase [Sphingomonas caeni]MCW3846509.1 2-dehydro-3-deoxygalactonokinase [Sphingomonas caeni]